MTVYPTSNTTYVATVEGGDQSDDCVASVRLEIPSEKPNAECVFLTASPSVITNPGQAVTLTWRTRNATSITVNNGVGSVTPVSDGYVMVHPTQSTTYVATVTNAKGSVNCQVSVTLVPVVTEEPRCIDLSATKSRIKPGEEVILSWVTRNASSISINNGIGNVTPVSSGSITVRPTSNTTYIATVPGAPNNPECEVRVSVEEDNAPRDRDHDRDRPDRDRERPEAFIDSVTRPAEPPLAAVYLSEIPYTGLDLGPVGTVVYWLMLILWSAAAAYLAIFNFLPYLFRRAAQDALHESGYLPGFGPAAVASIAPAAPTPAVHQAAHSAAVATAKPAASAHAERVYSPHEGFRSFASGGALTIDDIVKGLSRESEMELTRGPVEIPAPAAHAEAPVAKNERAYSDNIPGFIEALINGDRDHVFGTVRTIAKNGGDTEEFISEAVCALDDAYRARTEGTDVHPEVARITRDCHPSFLEKLVSSLATAVDSTYSTGVTGTKLALTRALAVVNG